MSPAALFLALLAASQEAGAPAPSRDTWALFHGLQASGRVEFHVPPGPTERAARRLEEAIGRRTDLEAATNPESFDSRAVRVLVGDAGDDRLAPLVERCGVDLLSDGFRFDGRDYRTPGDALCAVLEDPDRADRPLCLFFGNDLETLAVYMTEVPRLSRPALTIWADGDLAVRVSLAPDGTPLDDLVDHLAVRERLFAAATRETVRGVELVAPDLPRERWTAYARQLVPAWRRVETWLTAPTARKADEETLAALPAVEVLVYTHLEDLRAATGVSALSVVNRLHPRVHVLLAPGMPDDDGRGVLLALARAIAGEPAQPWLADALPTAAAGRWWGAELPAWCGRASGTLQFPDLDGAVGPDAGTVFGPHVLGPARGLAFSILSGARDQSRFLRALWNGGALPASAAGAQRAGELRERRDFLAATPRVGKARREALSGPVRRGIVLQLPYGEQTGGRDVGRALDEALALGPGPDAVALTVYASDAEPAPPLVRLEGGCVFGSPDDVELASAVAEAHARGLRVFLTVQPLSGPRGAWADVRAFNGLDAQAGFWERYERLVVHHALLAQLLGVEILAIGSDLRETSRTDPTGEVQDERLFEARRAGWKRVVECARVAFDGALTYVARFPSEANEVGFWDQLDFLSVAFFPPVARPDESPDDDQVRRLVRQALRDALDLAIVWNKPLLLAQVGFPARADAWSWPASPVGERDPGPQRRFLELLAEVLEGPLEDRETLRGLWLWCWPVAGAPAPGGASAADFWLNRPALDDVLARLFTH